MDIRVKIGDLVWAKAGGLRAEAGRVAAETKDGRGWIIETPKGAVVYLKMYVKRLKARDASKQARRIGRVDGPEPIHGDGELE